MGLDMYLERETYVKKWYHAPAESVYCISVSREKGTVIDVNNINYIKEEVGYWRKANAIHQWFVDNVQDGVDDCGRYYVTLEQLKELLGTVKIVLEEARTTSGKVQTGTRFYQGKKEEIYEDGKVVTNPEICQRLLPTQEGFFFGSTEYDNYYLEDLEYTRVTLERILREEEENNEAKEYSSYYYQASW